MPIELVLADTQVSVGNLTDEMVADSLVNEIEASLGCPADSVLSLVIDDKPYSLRASQIVRHLAKRQSAGEGDQKWQVTWPNGARCCACLSLSPALSVVSASRLRNPRRLRGNRYCVATSKQP
jgi:hypothetical protein